MTDSWMRRTPFLPDNSGNLTQFEKAGSEFTSFSERRGEPVRQTSPLIFS